MKIHTYLDPLREEILAVYSVSKISGAFTYVINPPHSNSKLGTISGTMTDKGYVKISLPQYPGKRFAAHRLAWIVWHGPIPYGLEIDHINRCKCDNSYYNLRIVTRGENMRNKDVLVSSTSGVLGVSWGKRAKKWCSYITVDKKRKSLGQFSNLADAIRVRKAAEVKYFTESAKPKYSSEPERKAILVTRRKHKKHACAPSEFVQKDVKFVNGYPPAAHVRKWFKVTKTGSMCRLFGSMAPVTQNKMHVPDCGVKRTFMPSALAWIYWNGDRPSGHFKVVHVDGNTSNFSKSNVKMQQSGVSWSSSTKRWRAYISNRGHVRHIGLFSTERDARSAYEKEAKRLSIGVL